MQNITTRPDGKNAYVIEQNGAALGWVSRSRCGTFWRALTVRGELTRHHGHGSAFEAVRISARPRGPAFAKD